MNELEAKKQWLVTESELNRAHLAEEWIQFRLELYALNERARPIASIVKTTAGVFAAFFGLRRAWLERTSRNGKRSWISRFVSGVQTGAALWQAVRRSRAP